MSSHAAFANPLTVQEVNLNEPAALEVKPFREALAEEVAKVSQDGSRAKATTKEEAFMTLVLMISDTRKRVAILSLLSFLALC